jgi:pyruvate carboxylase
MPGSVGTLTAAPGAKVKRGDLLLTLEAMKMETAVRAEIDGEVREVLVRPGQTVDAKELLVVLG